ILNADAGLNRLDYRSVESVFELIVQASGRSGRASDDGKVVLQVFNKNHYAVQCALEGNYKKFFNEEMRYRHSGQYPPYTFLISILVQGYKQEEIRNIAWGLKDKIQGNFKVLGASELIRIKELSRYRLLVKGKDIEEMKEKVSVEVRKLAQVTNATIIVDVNPIILE
ncbi:MAG: primosomal protein N', partial [Anaerorhabdus sp.]